MVKYDFIAYDFPFLTLGNEKIIELLIRTGADVNSKGEFEWRALHFCGQNGTDAAATVLISYQADIDPINVDGDTPLHIAVQHSNSNDNNENDIFNK